MGRFDNLPLLPSTVVGSHGKGSWWYAGVREHEKGVWGEGDLAEMLDDAADTAIRDMTKAGVDVITDGEVRRLDGYVDSYYTVIQNIQPIDRRELKLTTAILLRPSGRELDRIRMPGDRHQVSDRAVDGRDLGELVADVVRHPDIAADDGDPARALAAHRKRLRQRRVRRIDLGHRVGG